jgi:hypothetical protein
MTIERKRIQGKRMLVSNHATGVEENILLVIANSKMRNAMSVLKLDT